jgi:hypothetical protein
LVEIELHRIIPESKLNSVLKYVKTWVITELNPLKINDLQIIGFHVEAYGYLCTIILFIYLVENARRYS